MRRDSVGASSISLISAQARKIARSAAPPFPTKFRFCGSPAIDCVDRVGRDDVSGSGGGVKNTVTIVTTVANPKRIVVPTEQSADCTVDRRRKYHGFSLPADGGRLRKAEPLAVPYLLMWVPHANTAEASAEAANLLSARRQPTALCSRYG